MSWMVDTKELAESLNEFVAELTKGDAADSQRALDALAHHQGLLAAFIKQHNERMGLYRRALEAFCWHSDLEGHGGPRRGPYCATCGSDKGKPHSPKCVTGHALDYGLPPFPPQAGEVDPYMHTWNTERDVRPPSPRTITE